MQLIYLKIVTLLFPASDFRHPVTTPAFLYISQALTKVVCVYLCTVLYRVSVSQEHKPKRIKIHLSVGAALFLPLTQCAVMSLESVCAGLILSCIAVECVSLSRRFIPELINYLLGLLHLAVPTHTCTGNARLHTENRTHFTSVL